jgi:hypothetical protein
MTDTKKTVKRKDMDSFVTPETQLRLASRFHWVDTTL